MACSAPRALLALALELPDSALLACAQSLCTPCSGCCLLVLPADIRAEQTAPADQPLTSCLQPADLEAELEPAERQLYQLASWLVNDAAHLKALLSHALGAAQAAAQAFTVPQGLLEPFPLDTLVGGGLIAGSTGI
jgi:hypothetical protein